MSLPIKVNRCLSCCEKFTTLRKVISNLPHIATLVKNIGFKALLIAIILLNLSATPFRSGRLRIVLIYPGHGGADPGTMGTKSKEKKVGFKSSLKIVAYI